MSLYKACAGLEAIYYNKANYIFGKYQKCNLNMRNACKRRSRSFKVKNRGKFLKNLST